jgi:hypothetical protein
VSKSTFKISCTPENAPKFYEWIQTRGGVANWKSINLSNPGASWSSPVLSTEPCMNCQGRGEFPDHITCESCKGWKFQKFEKPNWQCGNTPEIVTSADEIGVYEDALFKAVPVRLKRGGGMFSLVLADSSQRNVDKIMAKCREKHGDAFYRKGVLDDCDASIGVYYTTREISLTEWIKNNPK